MRVVLRVPCCVDHEASGGVRVGLPHPAALARATQPHSPPQLCTVHAGVSLLLVHGWSPARQRRSFPACAACGKRRSLSVLSILQTFRPAVPRALLVGTGDVWPSADAVSDARASLSPCPTSASGATLTIHAALTPPRSLYSPTGGWASRLTQLERWGVALQNAAALVSSLGGGHFLCHQLAASRGAADAQVALCVKLGRPDLAARAALHHVYIDVSSGAFRTARARLALLRGYGEEGGRDGGLCGMLDAAEGYVTRAEGLVRRGLSPPPENAAERARDELHRWRVYK